MKSLVVFDSAYGNTEKIAQAIAGAIDGNVLRAKDTAAQELEPLELLIVGAPTYGGQPTPAMKEFLNKLPKSAVEGLCVAAFDTRITQKWVGIFGYAAGKIARKLQKLGGKLVVNPEGFFVTGTEGPLKEGEAERAADWAKEVLRSIA